MATSTPAVPRSQGRQLAELILAESARAGLGTGGRLPTERQLAADLGVTRSAVRHAMKMLEAEGRVSREVGRGTFLRDPDGDHPASPPGSPPASATAIAPGPPPVLTWAPAPRDAADAAGSARLDDVGPADVMAVRRLLEPLVMPLVVAWATSRDFEEMDRCLAGGDAAKTFEDFEAWDLALHRCLFAASHSQLLMRLAEVIESARHGHVWGDLKRRNDSQQRRADYCADHRAIVAALRARDADGAVGAMRDHLARVERNLLGATSR
jgi:GntR family transcriptional regulator, uxu operon transcriptional repressor